MLSALIFSGAAAADAPSFPNRACYGQGINTLNNFLLDAERTLACVEWNLVDKGAVDVSSIDPKEFAKPNNIVKSALLYNCPGANIIPNLRRYTKLIYMGNNDDETSFLAGVDPNGILTIAQDNAYATWNRFGTKNLSFDDSGYDLGTRPWWTATEADGQANAVFTTYADFASGDQICTVSTCLSTSTGGACKAQAAIDFVFPTASAFSSGGLGCLLDKIVRNGEVIIVNPGKEGGDYPENSAYHVLHVGPGAPKGTFQNLTDTAPDFPTEDVDKFVVPTPVTLGPGDGKEFWLACTLASNKFHARWFYCVLIRN